MGPLQRFCGLIRGCRVPVVPYRFVVGNVVGNSKRDVVAQTCCYDNLLTRKASYLKNVVAVSKGATFQSFPFTQIQTFPKRSLV